MHPAPQDNPKNTPKRDPSCVNVVWRFHTDAEGAWRWQQLDSERRVLSESYGSHATGYAASFSDPRGRFYYASVSYQFK